MAFNFHSSTPGFSIPGFHVSAPACFLPWFSFPAFAFLFPACLASLPGTQRGLFRMLGAAGLPLRAGCPGSE
eukprot:scaffold52131_cov17-Tisochrysis_lutea.AAC.2